MARGIYIELFFDTWSSSPLSYNHIPAALLPKDGQVQILSIPEDECDPFLVAGQTDITRQVDTGVDQGHDADGVG